MRILAAMVAMTWPTAHAATMLSGTLYFTTYQNQGGTAATKTTNVWKITFTYTSSPNTFVLNTPATPLQALTGADGIIFDPNDATLSTLLVGEQQYNHVAKLSTSGTILSEVSGGASGHTFSLTATPDKKYVLVLPNDDMDTVVNVLPLQPFGAGTSYTVTGSNTSLRGLDFIGNTAYYGNADDKVINGYLGTLDLSNLGTATLSLTANNSIAINDTVNHTAANGSLPTGAVTYDPYSGCLLIGSLNTIWQLCPTSGVPNSFDIVAKIYTNNGALVSSTTPPTCPSEWPTCDQVNWDTITVDGLGHIWGANNDGELIFIDYTTTKNIGTANFVAIPFAQQYLDDVVIAANKLPTTGTGCPATQGFWHQASNWPNVASPVTIDGVTYNSDHSMTIGSNTYTQTQLLSLLPSGSLHTGGWENGLSQFIAAVLNLAAGGQSAGIDSTISTLAGDLSTVQIFMGNKLSVPSNVQAAFNNAENTLNNYNSDVGLNCSEGSGLNIPSGR